MLPLKIIKKYYPKASDEELKDIQEVVYLLACAVMQEFYESEWMGSFEDSEQEDKRRERKPEASSIPVRVLSYRIRISQNSAAF